jgi:MinD-like ATPase involved in chromosome partitioning or flagellar assembly
MRVFCMVIVFLIGTAGSGKSLLTSSLNQWLKVGKQKSALVNLDPGVANLPYTPTTTSQQH